jgi:hypothetical protein
VKDIKTEKGKKINRKTLIVAFDIAQEKHMVYIRCPDGREEKPFVVLKRREGADRALFDEEGSKAGAGKSDTHEEGEGSAGKFSEQDG